MMRPKPRWPAWLLQLHGVQVRLPCQAPSHGEDSEAGGSPLSSKALWLQAECQVYRSVKPFMSTSASSACPSISWLCLTCQTCIKISLHREARGNSVPASALHLVKFVFWLHCHFLHFSFAWGLCVMIQYDCQSSTSMFLPHRSSERSQLSISLIS